MGLMDFIKSQFIEVIEWTDESMDTIAYRFPVEGNEIKMGAQLIVRESQAAVFVKDGQLADVYQPGKHTLSTENMPILTKIMSWPYGFNSPFKAEVYFINTKQFANQKWGTSNPIMMRDPEFGVLRLRAFGTYSFKVADPSVFLRELLGTNEAFSVEGINDQLKSVMVSGISDLIAELKIPALDLVTRYNELGDAAAQQIQPKFGLWGLKLIQVVIENLSLPEEVEKYMDQKTQMGIIGNMQQYTQFQTAQAIRDAAQNPNGMSGAFVGFGAGAALGQTVGQTMANAVNGGNSVSSIPAAASACPKCNTTLPQGAKFCSNCGNSLG